MPLRICRTFAAAAVGATLTFLTGWPARLAHQGNTSIAATRSAAASPTLQGNEAIEQLKQQGAYDSLAEAVAAVKYEARQQLAYGVAGTGGAYELRNPANNLLAAISPDGLQVTPLDGEKAGWRLGLTLTGYGYGKQAVSVGGGAAQAAGARVEIARQSDITEWFDNRPQGIEPGFTIASPPATSKAAGPLRLRLTVSGDLQPSVNPADRGAAFKSKSSSARPWRLTAISSSSELLLRQRDHHPVCVGTVRLASQQPCQLGNDHLNPHRHRQCDGELRRRGQPKPERTVRRHYHWREGVLGETEKKLSLARPINR